jgi:hypothetical protein
MINHLSPSLIKHTKKKTMTYDVGNPGPGLANFLFLVMAAILDTTLKGDHPRTIPPKFGSNWPIGFRGVD